MNFNKKLNNNASKKTSEMHKYMTYSLIVKFATSNKTGRKSHVDQYLWPRAAVHS